MIAGGNPPNPNIYEKMGFNIKDYILPPGTLIRFESNYYEQLSFSFHSLGMQPGTIALIIEHRTPFYIILLIDDKIYHLSCQYIVDSSGWISEFTPIYCGNGLREYPKW